MSSAAISRRSLLATGTGGLALGVTSIPSAARPADLITRFDPAFVDAEVERFRTAFEVPGYAIAVASNTKAYTAAALAIKGKLEPWGPDTFRTRFPAGFEDALVTFHPDAGRIKRVTMKPFSPLADFSNDFQHLDFTPSR